MADIVKHARCEACGKPIFQGLLTGQWFHHLSATTWPMPSAKRHTAVPSDGTIT